MVYSCSVGHFWSLILNHNVYVNLKRTLQNGCPIKSIREAYSYCVWDKFGNKESTAYVNIIKVKVCSKQPIFLSGVVVTFFISQLFSHYCINCLTIESCRMTFSMNKRWRSSFICGSLSESRLHIFGPYLLNTLNYIKHIFPLCRDQQRQYQNVKDTPMIQKAF